MSCILAEISGDAARRQMTLALICVFLSSASKARIVGRIVHNIARWIRRLETAGNGAAQSFPGAPRCCLPSSRGVRQRAAAAYGFACAIRKGRPTGAR